MNEIDKFFGDLPSEDLQEQDVFGEKGGQKVEDTTTQVVVEPKVPAKDGEGTEPHKNRKHRRWETNLDQRERDLIAREARIEALAGISQNNSSSSSDMPAEWVALYGNTPESKQAWQLQEKMFKDASERAKTEALKEFESKQEASRKEQKQFESFIDNELESLEDEYNVDLTSDAPAARKARREFLELVQNLSPKDASGTITGYADFDSTFQVYQKTRSVEKTGENVDRKKEIASKTMQQSAPGAVESEKQVTPGFRGWMKDLNISG